MMQFHHLGAVRAIQASKVSSMRRLGRGATEGARGAKPPKALLRPAPARFGAAT